MFPAAAATVRPGRSPVCCCWRWCWRRCWACTPFRGLGLSIYGINLVGQVMCFALLAMALDLMWGGAGVLSLGHGLFFAFGGYLAAMHLLKTAYAQTHVLPDFLQFMGQSTFPRFWWPFGSASLSVLAIMLLPGVLAFVFGYVSFRSRVNGVYFSIITQALTYTAMLLMFRNDTGFGGNNGMTGFHYRRRPADRRREGGGAADHALHRSRCWWCWSADGRCSPRRFGRMLTAIRDDEARLRFLGYDTLWLKLAAWCLSAIIAAVAGALYVPQVGIINPTLLDPSLSIEIAVWVAVGGRGGLCGAVIGAVLVNMLEILDVRGGAGGLAIRAGAPGAARGARSAQRADGPVQPLPRLDGGADQGRCARRQNRAEAAMSNAAQKRAQRRRTWLFSSAISPPSTTSPSLPAYGHVHAVIGPNGAGKTTLLDIFTGRSRARSGSVLLDGKLELTRLSEVQLALAGIGRKFQKPSVFEALTVVGKSRSRLSAAPIARCCARCSRAAMRARRDAVDGHSGDHRPRARSAMRWPALSRTARSNGWRSAWCWCASRRWCCWTSRWRG